MARCEQLSFLQVEFIETGLLNCAVCCVALVDFSESDGLYGDLIVLL